MKAFCQEQSGHDNRLQIPLSKSSSKGSLTRKKPISSIERWLIFGFYYYEKILTLVILFIITPAFFMFEITIVLEGLIRYYQPHPILIFLHICLCMFGFVNIAGNYALSILTDSSLKKVDPGMEREYWTYCKLCDRRRPMRAWHCKTCNICVLQRDHHCFFMSKCIGLYNRRYYILYNGYLCIAMIYTLIVNCLHITTVFENYDFMMALRGLEFLIQPHLFFNRLYEDLYSLLMYFNLFLILASYNLFVYHMKNALRGITSYEDDKNYKYSSSLVNIWRNFLNIFGTEWYLTLFWPFTNSRLPEHV